MADRLGKFYLQRSAANLLHRERVAMCLRHRISYLVSLFYSQKIGKAHYGGLAVCGSVWHCPVCASKITERRRVELAGALKKIDGVYSTLLMTFTIEHKREHSLKNSLSVLLKSYQEFLNSRDYRRVKNQYGLLGTVRAVEVTYTKNGWHPHFHVLLIFRYPVDPGLLELELARTWCESVAKFHRYATKRRGLVVTDGVGEYVAKFGVVRDSESWGIEHELTKANSKISDGGKGKSPWALLNDFTHGDKQAGILFQDYAREFKGKRQLWWSRGLRSMLGLSAEKTDEQLATEYEEDAFIFTQFGKDDWDIILENEIRGELLAVASSGDLDKVIEFLRQFGIKVLDYREFQKSLGVVEA